MAIDYSKLAHISDGLVNPSKRSAVAPSKLPSGESVLDKMEVRAKIADSKSIKVMILDDVQINKIMTAPREEKRKILSRLTDSQRRRVLARFRELQKIKDDESVDKLNLANLDALLNNCIYSSDEYNMQLLSQWKSIYDVPEEIQDFVTAVEELDREGIKSKLEGYKTFCDEKGIRTQISTLAGALDEGPVAASEEIEEPAIPEENEGSPEDFEDFNEDDIIPEFNEVSEEVSDSIRIVAELDCMKMLAGGVKDIWGLCDSSIIKLAAKWGCDYQKVADAYSEAWTARFAAYQQSVVDSRTELLGKVAVRRVMDTIIDEIAEKPLLDPYTGEEVKSEEEKPILEALSEALEAYVNGDDTLLSQIATTTIGGGSTEEPMSEDDLEEEPVELEVEEDESKPKIEVDESGEEFGDTIETGKVNDSTGDTIHTEIEGTEIGKDDDGNTVVETKNDEGEVENITLDREGNPISDGLMNWMRGGKPSKNLVDKFASWVQSNIKVQGGSLTKNAKTYLVVKMNVPGQVDIDGTELNLAKLKKSEDVNGLLAYFAPSGSYKKNETQRDDTISDSSEIELECPVCKLDEAAKEQEREDKRLAKELAQLLKLVEKGEIKDSAYSLVNPNTGNVLNSYDDLSGVEADASSYIDEGNDVVIYAQGKPYKYWNGGHWSEVKDSVNVLVDSLKSRVPALKKYNFKISDCAPVICPCEQPMNTINPSLTRSEYYDMCPVCPDYFDLVCAQYTTPLCPSCNEYQVQENGLCVNPNGIPQMYYPYGCSLQEIGDLLAGADSDDYVSIINANCCPMEDAMNLAAMTNNLGFIDNTFYKRHIGDSEWVFDSVPECLKSYTDKPGTIRLVRKATDSSIVLFGQNFELS